MFTITDVQRKALKKTLSDEEIAGLTEDIYHAMFTPNSDDIKQFKGELQEMMNTGDQNIAPLILSDWIKLRNLTDDQKNELHTFMASAQQKKADKKPWQIWK